MTQHLRLSWIVAAAILVAAGAAASAQTTPAGDPRTRLSMLVGTWTIEGSESTYRETCDWLAPASFVVCRGEDTDPRDPGVSLSILGYSPEEQAYTYTSFSGSGRTRSLRAWLYGDRWVFTGQGDRAGKSSRWQVSITPNAKGFHFRQETSVNGAPWATDVEIQYIRLK